jgi:uncharacterized protein (DUF1697 family)
MRYVALLRAVNVGGHKPVKMADLVKQFYAAGATNVATYIASGNVVFAHEDKDPLPALTAATGLPMFLRTRSRFLSIVDANPYPRDTDRLHLMLLPSRAKVTIPTVGPEEYTQRGTELYVQLPSGAGSSKLAARLGKLGGTMRNWRTVMALHAMTSA